MQVDTHNAETQSAEKKGRKSKELSHERQADGVQLFPRIIEIFLKKKKKKKKKKKYYICSNFEVNEWSV